jgi:hypothetical protein
MNFKDINSHETACKILGKSPEESMNIHDQLDDMADAINLIDGDYIADFKDKNQKKWRPIFVVDEAGFRFDRSYSVDSFSNAGVGSRLCQYFRSKEASDYFATEFLDMHEKCFNKRRAVKGAVIHFKEVNNHIDACKVLGKEPNQSATTDQKITDIFNAANKLSGFKPDFKDKNQKKWRPFFIMDEAGFRFDYSLYDGSRSRTSVGSRLCHYVGSEEEANHLGIQFLELHKEHYFGQ